MSQSREPRIESLATGCKPASLWFWAAVFLVVSTLASLPRFGQRENEHFPTVSDSDLYLEMARVFAGDASQFNREWVSLWPHHYNRPLVPWLAGWTAKYLLFGNARAAFSIINILAATLIALLLLYHLRTEQPDWRLAWVPSVLFLTGFPQLNWGYHILTDTAGYATALAVAIYGSWLLQRPSSSRVGAHSAGLFACSAIAFLTRETGWISVIAIGYVCLRTWRKSPELLSRCILILIVVVLGKLPHSLYSYIYNLRGVPLESSIPALMNWRYVLDFVAKTGVCFNLSWFLAALGGWLCWRIRWWAPPVYVGWAAAALLYIGAGYFVNKFHIIGYPLRLSYAVFPLVFFWVTSFFENRCPEGKRVRCALSFLVVQTVINLAGVFLDPGRVGVKATDLLQSVRHWLSW